MAVENPSWPAHRAGASSEEQVELGKMDQANALSPLDKWTFGYRRLAYEPLHLTSIFNQK